MLAVRRYDQAIVDYSEAIRLNRRLAVAFNNRCLTRAVVGKDLVTPCMTATRR